MKRKQKSPANSDIFFCKIDLYTTYVDNEKKAKQKSPANSDIFFCT